MSANSLSRIPMSEYFVNDTKAIFLYKHARDKERQLYILSLLLAGFIVLGAAGFSVTLLNLFHDSDIHFILFFLANSIFFLIILTFVWLRKKYQYGVSIGLICLLFIPAIALSVLWGPLLVQPLLLYILIITISGILLSAKAVFFTGSVVATLLISITYVHTHNLLTYDKSWFVGVTHVYDMRDAIVAVVSIAIVVTLSWFSRNQIEYALHRAYESERALRGERDLLDLRVKERTKELQIAQIERLEQINRFASFGRLSSGIIHNLINPLTAVAYTLQNVHSSHVSAKSKELQDILHGVDTAIEDVKLMEQIIDSARKQYQNQQQETTFAIKSEILKVMDLLGFKAKQNKVTLHANISEELFVHLDQVKFHQVISNLISNGIDAYDDIQLRTDDKRVEVLANQVKKDIIILIKDRGVGVPKRYLEKIFFPLFTTKSPDHGTGIGLYLCKEIVEKNFNGKIYVTSSKKEGTIFTMTIPTHG